VLTRPIAVLLALFLLLASTYNAAVPLGEGPDEPGHMAYVLFLAREGRIPVQRATPAASDVPGEGHQPPLAYLLALPGVLWLPPTERSLETHLSANPAFVWSSGTEPAAFVRASHEYWPWQGLTLAWHLVRGIAALLGAVTVYCTWQAARLLFDPRWPAAAPLLAAGLVAFNPQFLFTSALITNDTLLAALGAALCWLGLHTATRAPAAPGGLGRALALGALFGLALLTKQSALLFAPFVGWALWRGSGPHLRRTLAHGTAAGAMALLLAGWWFLRNWHLYGDPAGLSAFQATYATQPFAWGSLAAWGSALWQLFASFWAVFGWISLPAPTWVLALYALLTLAALVGLLRRGARPAALQHSPWLGVALLVVLALAWTLSFAFVAGLVAWQGRMLFPALPAIAMILAAGLASLGAALPRLLLPLLALLALALPLGVIAPAYEWRTLPPDHAQAMADQPVYARYAKPWEQGVVLRGWHAPPEPVAAGTTIEIRLLWHTLERVEHNWTVFVHLVDAEGAIVAEHNSIPQQGQFPMPRWTPGDWLTDTHPLALPPDLPPGPYTLRVGLYLPWQSDPRQGRRQEVWDAAGEPLGDVAEIGTLTVGVGTTLTPYWPIFLCTNDRLHAIITVPEARLPL
jgi:4-amino-4-deoxy-L-arabinose transferase-like glycosyltransferase